jgi:hypothetical protein
VVCNTGSFSKAELSSSRVWVPAGSQNASGSVVSDSIKSYFKFLLRLVFGHGEPGQGARAFWPGEVHGLCGMLAVGGTRPGRGGWWLTPVCWMFRWKIQLRSWLPGDALLVFVHAVEVDFWAL